jgi:pentose-5-phosphate-3-epimerase
MAPENLDIEVDGGIKPETIPDAASAGRSCLLGSNAPYSQRIIITTSSRRSPPDSPRKILIIYEK